MGEPLLSVVVASWQPLESLGSCLEALRRAAGEIPVETIVVRAVGDEAQRGRLRALAANVPGARVLEALPASAVPDLRAIGARAAAGEVVALLEDHCRPGPGWCDAAHRLALRRGVVGGPIANVRHGSLSGRAAYFAEYGAHAPLAGGIDARGQWPSGANAAYRRELLLAALEEFPRSPPWEGPLHAALARRGLIPVVAGALLVEQERRIGFLAALRERYRHGREFAREEIASSSGRRGPGRAWRALAAPAVPAVLLARVAGRARRSSAAALLDLAVVSPLVMLLFVAWSVGELTAFVVPDAPAASAARSGSVPRSDGGSRPRGRRSAKT